MEEVSLNLGGRASVILELTIFEYISTVSFDTEYTTRTILVVINNNNTKGRPHRIEYIDNK